MKLTTALILAFWHALSPGLDRLPSAKRIAAAIVRAVEADPLPAVYGESLRDAAMLAYFAVRESSLDPRAVGDGGRSRGVWQMRGACGSANVEAQAACWLRMLHDSDCDDHPVAAMWGVCSGLVPYGTKRVPVEKLAAKREERAFSVLAKIVEPPLQQE